MLKGCINNCSVAKLYNKALIIINIARLPQRLKINAFLKIVSSLNSPQAAPFEKIQKYVDDFSL